MKALPQQIDASFLDVRTEATTPQPTYETRRWPYFLALPLMWALTLWVMGKKCALHLLHRRPVINTYWFDGLSARCRAIKEGAATWRALNLIYNHRFGADGRLTDFWLGMMNAQAVRNRARLVASLLAEQLRVFRDEGEIRLLSLASGSAQSVLEALVLLQKEGLSVQAVLVDHDAEALAHSRELAEQYGVAEHIVFLQKDMRGLLRLKRSLKNHLPFHVVEMVGFIEYFPDRSVLKLFRLLRSMLAPGGTFLTSSIGSNPERWFLHWVINWQMIYRGPQHLRSLIREAGFSPPQIISEPHGIHHVALCIKTL